MFGVGFSMLLWWQAAALKAGVETLLLGAVMTETALSELQNQMRFFQGN